MPPTDDLCAKVEASLNGKKITQKERDELDLHIAGCNSCNTTLIDARMKVIHGEPFVRTLTR